MLDAVVVGAGPNGLSAAVELARRGHSVLVIEAAPAVGGAARTEELTLSGFRHDTGSAVYPLGAASPFFRSLPLEEHGLTWVHPELPLAHPFDGGTAVVLHRDPAAMTVELERDGAAYRRLVEPLVTMWPTFVDHVLASPLRPPRDAAFMARFGLRAFRSTTGLCRGLFKGPAARALFAGNAAHTGTPLDFAFTAGVALTLMGAAHAVGWPMPRGGAASITRALASLLVAHGGEIETGRRVAALEELPPTRAVLLDVTPRQLLELAGERLPPRYRRRMRAWKYGPGAFKLDWALDAPVPWQAEACRRAGTVHLGGTLEEIARAERAPWEGRVAEAPFVILAQPTLCDPTRAPEGKHVAWAYCHVPNGWAGDATAAVEAQVERFAPGFRETILGRHVHTPATLQAWNPNLVGGDVNGGALTPRQALARPVASPTPWVTPLPDVYLCSAATAPGGGVHGMCGFHAARCAMKRSLAG